MGIFRRRATQDQDEQVIPDIEGTDESTTDESATEEVAEEVADEIVEAEPDTFDRSRGPFDRAEVDDVDGRLDLGGLLIGATDGMQLQLQIDPEAQAVNAAVAMLGPSSVQLQAFAAPRSGGLWAEIRREIMDSITSQGGTAEVVAGPFGPELQTRMPQAGRDGRTVFAPARFVGVDGPRWFLRAVISGPAAIGDAEPVYAIVRDTVVVRGESPMAPREMLPMQLPETSEEGAEPEPDATPDLNPFERGPEITEVH